MLVRLGTDGVIQGVKDSSGDDVSFRWLCLENEDAGHPLQIFTGTRRVDEQRLVRCRRFRSRLANITLTSYVEQWRAYQAAIGQGREIQDHLAA